MLLARPLLSWHGPKMASMNVLYPRFTFRQFGWMIAFGAAGAMVAGAYGIVHDQITFTLGPEYFTRFKFDQFDYLDKAKPVRIVVGEIGFLATWWVGFFAGWFMGRVAVPHLAVAKAARLCAAAVGIMLTTAIAFAVVSAFLAPMDISDSRIENWRPMMQMYAVTDEVAFIRVGYIHNASYLGGLIGLIVALVWLRRQSRLAA